MFKQKIPYNSIFFFLLMGLIIQGCTKEVDPEWAASVFGSKEALPQKILDAQKYDAFPAARRTTYFHEDFTNNANAWPLLSPTTSISGGVFFSYGRQALITKQKPIDETKDFEVEMIIGFRDMLSVSNNGVIWNYNSSTKKYWGVFNTPSSENANENMALCGQFNNGTNEVNTGVNKVLNYNANGISWNKYTMRKVGDYIITFIDGVRMSTRKYISTGGNSIGINDPGGIGVDKIYIDYIN